MNKKPITLEERKAIQLEMLKDIDSFCREHDITYYLAYGTLLGAIRHKGYIPWDDDVDLMIKREDAERLKREFTSDICKYSDIDTEDIYTFPFPRITHKGSYSSVGKVAKSYGICIDLYVLEGIPDDKESYFKKVRKIQKMRLVWNRIAFKFLRNLPLQTFPLMKLFNEWHRNILRKYPLETSNCYGIDGDYKVFNKAIFSEKVEVDFEGYKFFAPAGFDEFLTVKYGDYMTPPPPEKRIPYHGGTYYWK